MPPRVNRLSSDPEVPDEDALDQAREVPFDDDGAVSRSAVAVPLWARDRTRPQSQGNAVNVRVGPNTTGGVAGRPARSAAAPARRARGRSRRSPARRPRTAVARSLRRRHRPRQGRDPLPQDHVGALGRAAASAAAADRGAGAGSGAARAPRRRARDRAVELPDPAPARADGGRHRRRQLRRRQAVGAGAGVLGGHGRPRAALPRHRRDRDRRGRRRGDAGLARRALGPHLLHGLDRRSGASWPKPPPGTSRRPRSSSAASRRATWPPTPTSTWRRGVSRGGSSSTPARPASRPTTCWPTGPIRDELVDTLVRQVHAFYGDDPQRSASYARIVNQRHLDRLRGLLADGAGKVAVGRSVRSPPTGTSPRRSPSTRHRTGL